MGGGNKANIGLYIVSGITILFLLGMLVMGFLFLSKVGC